VPNPKTRPDEFNPIAGKCNATANGMKLLNPFVAAFLKEKIVFISTRTRYFRYADCWIFSIVPSSGSFADYKKITAGKVFIAAFLQGV
jgi:hypothetical protein